MASWAAARVAVVTVCRTWVGLALLGSDPHGLPALVALLFQPMHPRLLYAPPAPPRAPNPPACHAVPHVACCCMQCTGWRKHFPANEAWSSHCAPPSMMLLWCAPWLCRHRHVLLDTIAQVLHPPTHWQAPAVGSGVGAVSGGGTAAVGDTPAVEARRGLAVNGATIGSHAFARSGALGLQSQLPSDTSRDMTRGWASGSASGSGAGASSTSRRRAKGKAARATALHARALRLLRGEVGAVGDPPWAAGMPGASAAAGGWATGSRGRGVSSATGDTDASQQGQGNGGASGRVSVFGLVEGCVGLPVCSCVCLVLLCCARACPRACICARACACLSLHVGGGRMWCRSVAIAVRG